MPLLPRCVFASRDTSDQYRRSHLSAADAVIARTPIKTPLLAGRVKAIARSNSRESRGG
jgi:hypothetical protein